MSLACDAAFYRRQAEDCQRMIDGLDDSKPCDRVARVGFVKDRDLWLRMADEIDAYLGALLEEAPPLLMLSDVEGQSRR